MAGQRAERRAARRQVLLLFRWQLQTFAELLRHAQPKWVAAPKGATSVMSFRPDQCDVDVELGPDDLRSAADTIARLLRDLPDVDRDDPYGARPVTCWLSCPDAGDGEAPVVVHIGKRSVGELTGPAGDLARELIAAHGGRLRAVRVIAGVSGARVEDASLRLVLPDRP